MEEYIWARADSSLLVIPSVLFAPTKRITLKPEDETGFSCLIFETTEIIPLCWI
jgi:hypothetical protein